MTWVKEYEKSSCKKDEHWILLENNYVRGTWGKNTYEKYMMVILHVVDI